METCANCKFFKDARMNTLCIRYPTYVSRGAFDTCGEFTARPYVAPIEPPVEKKTKRNVTKKEA